MNHPSQASFNKILSLMDDYMMTDLKISELMMTGKSVPNDTLYKLILLTQLIELHSYNRKPEEN